MRSQVLRLPFPPELLFAELDQIPDSRPSSRGVVQFESGVKAGPPSGTGSPIPAWLKEGSAHAIASMKEQQE
jgi:hypothetical protein